MKPLLERVDLFVRWFFNASPHASYIESRLPGVSEHHRCPERRFSKQVHPGTDRRTPRTTTGSASG